MMTRRRVATASSLFKDTMTHLNNLIDELISLELKTFSSLVASYMRQNRIGRPTLHFHGRMEWLASLIAKGLLKAPKCHFDAWLESWLEMPSGDIPVIERGNHLSDVKLAHCEIVITGQCHAVSALNWQLMKGSRPNLRIYSGITDLLHFHTWLYDPDTKTIFEPTPYIRSYYAGAPVDDEKEFLMEEIQNIRALEGLSPDVYYRFCKLTILE